MANKAKNFSGIKWNTKRGVAFFSGRSYGIINAEGKALSQDGINPRVCKTMGAAKIIAPYADGIKNSSWVEVFS